MKSQILKEGRIISTLEQHMKNNNIKEFSMRDINELMLKEYQFEYSDRRLKHMVNKGQVYKGRQVVRNRGQKWHPKNLIMTYIVAFLVKEAYNPSKYRELLIKYKLKEPENAERFLRLIDAYRSKDRNLISSLINEDEDIFLKDLAKDILNIFGLKHSIPLADNAEFSEFFKDELSKVISRCSVIEKELKEVVYIINAISNIRGGL